jgi:hypothetical protein
MEYFFRAVTGTQKFQYGLRCDPFATDRRFTIANRRIDGDPSVKKAYHGRCHVYLVSNDTRLLKDRNFNAVLQQLLLPRTGRPAIVWFEGRKNGRWGVTLAGFWGMSGLRGDEEASARCQDAGLRGAGLPQ